MGVIIDRYGDKLNFSKTDEILIAFANTSSIDSVKELTGCSKGYINKTLKNYQDHDKVKRWTKRWKSRMAKCMLLGKVVGNYQFLEFAKAKDDTLLAKVILEKGKGKTTYIEASHLLNHAVIMWFEELYG